MAQTNLCIRLDENLKNEFTALCMNLGLSVSSACIVFMKKAVSERRIPFDITENKKIIECLEEPVAEKEPL